MWTDDKTQIVITCIKNKFRNVPHKSNISKSILEREHDPEQFIRRVTPQIIECYNKGYQYATPEEWDFCFHKLGGGQHRRKASAILKRMSWDQFLYNVEIIIKEYNRGMHNEE